jgi:hypothetical protein
MGAWGSKGRKGDGGKGSARSAAVTTVRRAWLHSRSGAPIGHVKSLAAIMPWVPECDQRSQPTRRSQGAGRLVDCLHGAESDADIMVMRYLPAPGRRCGLAIR